MVPESFKIEVPHRFEMSDYSSANPPPVTA
jgi:hypothetical protein